MTLTPEQLDELEAKARAASSLLSSITSMFVPAATAIHLVAVYRAALAWSEARADHRNACDMANQSAQRKTLPTYQDAIESLFKLMQQVTP